MRNVFIFCGLMFAFSGLIQSAVDPELIMSRFPRSCKFGRYDIQSSGQVGYNSDAYDWSLFYQHKDESAPDWFMVVKTVYDDAQHGLVERFEVIQSRIGWLRAGTCCLNYLEDEKMHQRWVYPDAKILDLYPDLVPTPEPSGVKSYSVLDVD